MQGAAALKKWMTDRDITVRALSKEIGCSESYLSHIRAGRRLPGRRLATALERETGGAITVATWDAVCVAGEPVEEREAA